VIYVLYNVKLEKALGSKGEYGYSDVVYCWLNKTMKGKDYYFYSHSEKFLSILVTFGVGLMDEGSMWKVNDSAEVSKIVRFIYHSGARFKDIVVVPVVRVDWSDDSVGAALLDFAEAYPILDLVEECR